MSIKSGQTKFIYLTFPAALNDDVNVNLTQFALAELHGNKL